jgi:3-hydroxy-9,10-secoandrosta-1,3,5(10)-triene-9,17-dione monooxygenase reductase component
MVFVDFSRAPPDENFQVIMADRDIDVGSPEFRKVMGHFCTGVVIVSALLDEQLFGMTCQSFMSVSLAPPLVAFCPAHTSTSWPSIRAAGKFCVNVLALDQQALGEKFARSGADKFEGVNWTLSEGGNPSIEGCLAHIDCALEDVYSVGDHDIVIGRVRDLHLSRRGAPLLFYQGKFANLAS